MLFRDMEVNINTHSPPPKKTQHKHKTTKATKTKGVKKVKSGCLWEIETAIYCNIPYRPI